MSATQQELIEQTIRQLRTQTGWWNGDRTAARVLANLIRQIEDLKNNDITSTQPDK